MAQFYIKTNNVKAAADAQRVILAKLAEAESDIRTVSNTLAFQVAAKANIRSRLSSAANRVSGHRAGMNSMRTALQDVASTYERTENVIKNNARVKDASFSGIPGIGNVVPVIKPALFSGISAIGHVRTAVNPLTVVGIAAAVNMGKVTAGSATGSEDSKVFKFKDWLWEVTGSAGPAGKIIGSLGKVVTGDWSESTIWGDVIKGGWKIGESAGKIYKVVTSDDSVGVKWKNLFKPDITKVLKPEVSTSDVVFSVIKQGLGNYDEYKTGAITADRAVAETVVETAIEVTKDYAIKSLAGATIGSVIAATGAPVILTTAATVTVAWAASKALDWASQKLTGEKFTEAVSDAIVDLGEKGLEKVKEGMAAVGKGAKKVKEGATAIWKGISGGWKKVTGGGGGSW